MYRVIKTGRKYYAIEIDLDSASEIENIQQFVAESVPVLLVDHLSEAADIFMINENEIEIVE